MQSPNAVIRFWFEECTPKQWWQKDAEFDQSIAERFGPLHRRATLCELWSWRQTAEGRLAEILLLDQFSRNIFRDTPHAFSQDPLALALAQEAVALGADQALPETRRVFFYLPYMHSESKTIHQQAITLFDQPGMEDNLRFEKRHKQIIDRFGRYPHRNDILGRTSTDAEMAFLQEPGSSF